MLVLAPLLILVYLAYEDIKEKQVSVLLTLFYVLLSIVYFVVTYPQYIAAGLISIILLFSVFIPMVVFDYMGIGDAILIPFTVLMFLPKIMIFLVVLAMCSVINSLIFKLWLKQKEPWPYVHVILATAIITMLI